MKSATCRCYARHQENMNECCYDAWKALLRLCSKLGIEEAYRQHKGTGCTYYEGEWDGLVLVKAYGEWGSTISKLYDGKTLIRNYADDRS